MLFYAGIAQCYVTIVTNTFAVTHSPTTAVRASVKYFNILYI